MHTSLAPYPATRYQLLLVTCKTLLILHSCFLGGFWGVLGGVRGADNVLGCPPFKIFSWTCCYAMHSSLAPYPATRYQLLLVTCKTLLMRKPSSVLSSVAGTQSIDRAWLALKAWLPQKLKTYEKRNGHHKMSQGVHSMIQQWMWRQTILPCSSKELMSCLVDLLKKYHDFQWRLHPLKQIVWLHCKMTKKHIFPHLITRWSRFSQWHGCVKDPKWTGMLWPL